jgi:type IV secretion system protein VirD4
VKLKVPSLRPSVPVYGGFRESYAAFGQPGSGKTTWLARTALTAPGAALVFSTREDIARDTAVARSRDGRPVWWVNPGRLGGFPSNCGFSPLAGCTDPRMAIEAAGALMTAKPHDAGGRDAHWDALSKDFLQALLHAAALADPGTADILTVRRWAADPVNAGEAMEILDWYGADGWAQDLDDLSSACARDGNHAAAVASGARGALSWLSDPALRVLACPPPEHEFNAAEFLRRQGTVYLIGSGSEHNPLQPYLSCFVTYVWNEADRAAGDPACPFSSQGRLDPPLFVIGDEPGNTCLVPYDRWASTAGGRGVVLFTGWQSVGQMPRRWGAHAETVMLDAFTCKIVFGGVTGQLAEDASKWAGNMAADGGKEAGAPVVPVFAPEKIGTLPDYRAMVKYRNRRCFLADMPDVRSHPWYAEAVPADFTHAWPGDREIAALPRRPAVRVRQAITLPAPEPQPAIAAGQ